MRRKKKRRYTVIKPFTPFERTRTKEMTDLLKMGIDPSTINIVSIGGESQYRTSDFCNMFELTGHGFDVVATSLQRKTGGSGDERFAIN